MEADTFEACEVGTEEFSSDTKEILSSSSPQTEPRKEKIVDVRQVRREFARLTQLFETFPIAWQTCVHDYVQVYKEALSANGVTKAETKKCAWEFQGALLQQLEGADLKDPTPSRGADMGVWVSRVFASAQPVRPPPSAPRSPTPGAPAKPGGPATAAAEGAAAPGGPAAAGAGSAFSKFSNSFYLDAARAYVHEQLLSWACSGAVWSKRWSAEPLPSEDNLKAPVRDPCAICLETIKTPMRMACGHEFCARCVCKTVMAAFQAGRGPGCPFRCAEWMSSTEVEAVRSRDFAAALETDETSAFETSSEEEETPRFSAELNENLRFSTDELRSGSEIQSVASIEEAELTSVLSDEDEAEALRAFDEEEFDEDLRLRSPLPTIDGGFADLRQNLLVTRTLLQRQGNETTHVNVGRLQHHLAALEILLGANE